MEEIEKETTVHQQEEEDSGDYVYPDGTCIKPSLWTSRTIEERQNIWQHYVSGWLEEAYQLTPEQILEEPTVTYLGEPYNFEKQLSPEGQKLANETFEEVNRRVRDFLEKFSESEEVNFVENADAILQEQPTNTTYKSFFHVATMLFLLGVPADEIEKIEEAMDDYGIAQKSVAVQILANALKKDVITYEVHGNKWTGFDFEIVLGKIVPRENWNPPPVIDVKPVEEDDF